MTQKNKPTYTCPCCGYIVFREKPGNSEICPICFWEDDIVQLKNPNYEGGANNISLIQAQKNYQNFQASEQQFIKNTKTPNIETKNKDWFPIEKNTSLGKSLYYWKK